MGSRTKPCWRKPPTAIPSQLTDSANGTEKHEKGYGEEARVCVSGERESKAGKDARTPGSDGDGQAEAISHCTQCNPSRAPSSDGGTGTHTTERCRQTAQRQRRQQRTHAGAQQHPAALGSRAQLPSAPARSRQGRLCSPRRQAPLRSGPLRSPHRRSRSPQRRPRSPQGSGPECARAESATDKGPGWPHAALAPPRFPRRASPSPSSGAP